MKLFFSILLISTIVLFSNCNSSKKLTGTFKAKLVATLCNQHIVEIQDPKFYKLGTNWKDYKNVFTISNHCNFVTAHLKEGDLFDCKIIQSEVLENCMSCEAFMETPNLKRAVQVIQ